MPKKKQQQNSNVSAQQSAESQDPVEDAKVEDSPHDIASKKAADLPVNATKEQKVSPDLIDQ